MKVKLISDLNGHSEQVVEVQDNVSEFDIEAMFPVIFGVEYNENHCSYEPISGRIYSKIEVLKYTE